jgi:hypothetical protein
MGKTIGWLASRARLRFWGRAFIAGSGWALRGIDLAARWNAAVVILLALVGIAAVAVPVLLPHHSFWLVSVAIAVLLLVILGEGAFRIWRKDRTEADERVEAADERVKAADARGQEAQERLRELEGEPVSDGHRDDLQAVARVVLSYVRALQEIRSYLATSGLSPNIAYGFREHFPDLAKDLDDWTEEAKKLNERRESFAKAVERKVEALGNELDLPISPSAARDIARIAEGDAHGLPFTEAPVGPDECYLMLGGSAVVSAPIASFDRVNVERRLRSILTEAASDVHREIVVATRRILEDDQEELESELTLIADKDSIQRGEGCRLC